MKHNVKIIDLKCRLRAKYLCNYVTWSKLLLELQLQEHSYQERRYTFLSVNPLCSEKRSLIIIQGLLRLKIHLNCMTSLFTLVPYYWISTFQKNQFIRRLWGLRKCFLPKERKNWKCLRSSRQPAIIMPLPSAFLINRITGFTFNSQNAGAAVARWAIGS